MTKPFNLIWAEGQLMTQQHLQQFQYYIHQQYKKMFKRLLTLPGGLFDIDISQQAVLQGEFVLHSCHGVFADGHYLEIETPIYLYHCQEGMVYLCLANNQMVDQLDGYTCDIDIPTFIGQSVEVADHFDARRKANLQVKDYNYFLSQKQSDIESCQHIAVAKLLQTGVGCLRLCEDYCPPCLNLFAWGGFLPFIEELKHYCGWQLNKFSNQHFAVDSMVVYALRRFINQCQLAITNQLYSPDDFVRDARELIAILGGEHEVQYHHQQAANFLQYVTQKIQQRLPCLVPKQLVSIYLQRQSESLYYSENLQKVLQDDYEIYLYCSLAASDPKIILFSQQIKIVAVSQIDEVVHAALPGLPLDVVNTRPPELSQQGCYFRCQEQHELWQQIISERQLAIFVTQEFLYVDIQLIVRERL